MVVADHEDAGSAIANGFDHAAIFYLAVRSVSESKPAQAERNSDGEVAIGCDAAGVDDLEIEPKLTEWDTTKRRNAESEGPMHLYQSEIAELRPAYYAYHSETGISETVI